MFKKNLPYTSQLPQTPPAAAAGLGALNKAASAL